MTADELRGMLDKHAKWTRSEDGGEKADLYGADLRGANLCGADLRGANLSRANLYGANLYEADLREANLYGANLYEADLREANLRGANLCKADLRGANLCKADLREADLCKADLREANLCGADLRGADLREANNIPSTTAAQLLTCPESGAFEAWKKCREGVLVRVRIPADARRSSATTRKCRAEYVDVLEVIGAEVGISQHDNRTEYRAGQRATCHEWCEDRWQECAGGIHFFITRAEAEAY